MMSRRKHHTFSLRSAIKGIATACLLFFPILAKAETRSLSIIHKHTGEEATITFKVNGNYSQDGLKKLNWMLRDWRKDEPTEMDPELFDILWEVYKKTGASEPIHVVSAYRSAGTNAMLRRRSRGVARNSQHIQGKAVDLYIPEVSTNKIRETAMKMERGGVGFYPRAGTAFLHIDSGSVRHWPKMSRENLVRLFPDGNTVHIPADGKPLSGFDTALAKVQSRGGFFSRTLAFSGRGDVDDEKDFVRRQSQDANLLGRLFGGKPRQALFAESPKPEPIAPRQIPITPKPEPVTIVEAKPQLIPIKPEPPKPIVLAKFEAPLPQFAPREREMMRATPLKAPEPVIKLGNTTLPKPNEPAPIQLASATPTPQIASIKEQTKTFSAPLPLDDPRSPYRLKAKEPKEEVKTAALKQDKPITLEKPVAAKTKLPLEPTKPLLPQGFTQNLNLPKANGFSGKAIAPISTGGFN